jgi:hypothetical protein
MTVLLHCAACCPCAERMHVTTALFDAQAKSATMPGELDRVPEYRNFLLSGRQDSARLRESYRAVTNSHLRPWDSIKKVHVGGFGLRLLQVLLTALFVPLEANR